LTQLEAFLVKLKRVCTGELCQKYVLFAKVALHTVKPTYLTFQKPIGKLFFELQLPCITRNLVCQS